MTTQHDTAGLNSWIEISESAYAANLAFFRRLVGADVELSAVVKSNAYGHGLLEIAALAIRHGADSFCVHALEEALALREAGFGQDVLILGHVPLARLDQVVEHDFRVVLYDLESARKLADFATADRPARVHLKIETGTHRQGVEGEDLGTLLDFLKPVPAVYVEGVYTHFANIEDTTDHRYARRQAENFQLALRQIEDAGFRPTKRHAACSAAVALFPETHLDMVRLGISQYGFWSSKETRLSFHNLTDSESAEAAEDVLRPVMTWKTRVSQVKWIPADSCVGYGCTYQTTRRTRLAVLPTGYADGYDRKLSSAGHVLVRGRRAPVLGRICMNLTMIDVTDVSGVEVEDEVVLLGRQVARETSKEITAEQMASIVGTIPYEIVARIAPHMPRIVVD